ncbi:methylamine utilization protein [Luteimonas fraxinea]|uniref:Methylamine utilization protein n=1 Tax=Luteimonas fraxinea TaxID=2901869 RepID=A0ABS8UE72_9GAMM|nr:methylamine utilization protein [Luteimonas fraxinea]MCD9097768.1 methylamine utilization protein [Luteimonas fraxinea]UHH09483.1 methylamine utilization protein [Luteimonas fraxinea]
MIASNRLRLWLGQWCLCALAVCAVDSAAAASLTVAVDGAGERLEGAVVSLHSAAARAAIRPMSAEMDQRQAEFVPHVLPVTIGSRVRFPNSDNFRHQVYSFSPAQRFELPLYSGRQAQPVVFDTPGVVELGCNIHDWMLGYVIVLDTPYFATTGADGDARIEAPAGDYTLQVWHERLEDGPGARVTRRVHVGAPRIERVTLELEAARAPPQPADARLRHLQERFRSLKRGG